MNDSPAKTSFHSLRESSPISPEPVVLANVGDCNGDGSDDIGLGIPFGHQTNLSGGRVLILSGKDFHTLKRLDAPKGVFAFGFSLGVTTASSEGMQSLFVGAPGYSSYGDIDPNEANRPGCVVAYSVSDWSTITQVGGDRASSGFGHAIALTRLGSGKGTALLAIGDPGYVSTNNHLSTGAVSVFDGSLRLQRRMAASDGGHQSHGAPHYRWGHSIVWVPDLDSDGNRDLVIGDPDYRATPVTTETTTATGIYRQGIVEAVSSATGRVLWSRGGEGKSDRFGYAMLRTIDCDMDGTSDLIVTALDRPATIISLKNGRVIRVIGCAEMGVASRSIGHSIAALDGFGTGNAELWALGSYSLADLVFDFDPANPLLFAMTSGNEKCVWSAGHIPIGVASVGISDVNSDSINDLLSIPMSKPLTATIYSGKDGAIVSTHRIEDE